MIKSIAVLSLLVSMQTFAHDETLIQQPIKESNELSLYGSICQTRDHDRWDVCFHMNEDDTIGEMKSFRFSNVGVNKIVPNSGFMVGRDFDFGFEDLARSDMGLLVWDQPDEQDSHSHLKMMFFFPRDIMPAIRYESDANKDIVIVTLPTQEEVIFNGKTKEIISGALTEGPIKQKSTGHAVAPDVQYNGKYVVVEATAQADWPVGFTGANAAKTVTIKKKGQKNCIVQGSDLWFTDQSKGGNVMFNKSLISNEAFDGYVKKMCGFSIY